MNKLSKHKKKIIIGAVVAAVLALAFWWGGNSLGLSGPKSDNSLAPAPTASVKETKTPSQPTKTPSQTQTPEPGREEAAEEENPETAEDDEEFWYIEEGDEEYSIEQGMELDETGADMYQTEAVPYGRPVPEEPQNITAGDEELKCTLTVKCDTILSNTRRLNPEKAELVPSDGVIFPEQTVVFYDGESVFNILLREMKRNKIHFEFKNTPVFNSAYIEGINNIYEFDCGELSGWMYRVNDWFPNYGCSRYRLKAGDKVEIIYTCDLGKDIGGNYLEQREE